MSGIFVVAPVLTVAPVVFSATSAVAAALGFVAATRKLDELSELLRDVDTVSMVASTTVVQFDIDDATGLRQIIDEQGPLVFERGDATLCFRAGKGRVQLMVTAPLSRSREELEALGQQVLGGINQQYAYHSVMSDLKRRGFGKVEETKDVDGTIRLRLRRWD